MEDILPPTYASEDPPPKYSQEVLPNQQWEVNTRVHNLIGLSTTFQIIFMGVAGCFESYMSLAIIFVSKDAGSMAIAIS